MQTRQVVERLLAHKCFTKERLEEFTNGTSINALARVCALTVELLLSLSMVERINSVTSPRRAEGTALDFPFFGAGDARLT